MQRTLADTGVPTRLTLPVASFIAYSYDDAHRLIAIAGGTLTRSVSRSIDALGRVQQTTGRE